MSNPSHIPRSLLHRLGVAGPARLCVSPGTATPKAGRGNRAPRTGLRLILSVLATTLGALAFTSAPALAAPGHIFGSSFATKGTGPGQLEDPTGIAVSNATGNVYVVDKTNNRVEEFNPTGTKLEAEFKGSGTAGELSEPEAIAIDNSGKTQAEDPSVGDVYVTDHNVVDKFEANGTYVGQITEAEGAAFAPLAGVAVDPKGVVWVYQGLGQEHPHIDAFSDARASAFLSGRESKASCEAFSGLAVDSEDNLYVAHACEVPHVHIAKLNSSGEVHSPPPSTGSSFFSVLGGEEQKTGVAVEASSNNVYIDSEPTESGEPAEIEEFAPSGTKIETFGAEQLTGNVGTALAVSYANVSSGDVYVLDPSAGTVDIFAPPKATTYAESFHFGGKGTGSGEFTEPLGVAVNDATEDVYVVDKGNKRVEDFSKSGAFITEFASPEGFNEPEAIAVDNCKNGLGEPCSKLEDPSVGDVYVTDQRPALPERKGGVANSVFVAEVDKFSSTGTYLSQLRRCPEDERSGSTLTNRQEKVACVPEGHPTAGFDQSLTGVAVGPEGNVWVGAGNVLDSFDEFSDTGTFLNFFESSSYGASTDWTGGPFGPAGPGIVAGSSALDPLTGELFVDRESVIDRYASGEASPTGLLETFPGTGGLQGSAGIAVSPAGTVYATERTADDVKAFGEFPLAQVAVGAVANLRPTSVTLQGSVNPEGFAVTECVFEYGETTSYGKTAACEHPDAAEIGSGTSPVEVHADLESLPPGTTYHYRLVASDHAGTNRGSDHVFTTPGPSITEEQATYVEATAATLQATIDPNGGATSYRFEYDTSPYTSGAFHGTSLPVPNTSIGSGTSAVPVSVRVTGLQPGTVYYYRVVAAGEPLGAPEVFYGLGQTFTTNPGPAGGGGFGSLRQRRAARRTALWPHAPRLPRLRDGLTARHRRPGRRRRLGISECLWAAGLAQRGSDRVCLRRVVRRTDGCSRSQRAPLAACGQRVVDAGDHTIAGTP